MRKTILTALATVALAVSLSACAGPTDLAGRKPDPVQVQAGLNGEMTPSSAPCDYMPPTGVGRRSGGSLIGWMPQMRNLGGIDGSYAAKLGLKVTPDGEAEWAAVYKPVLEKLVANGTIKSADFASYSAVYGCRRDAGNPNSRTIQFTSPDGF